MLKKLIAGGLALIGLVAIGTGLFIFVTQPLINGDPNGTLVKSLCCGIAGFLSVLIGSLLPGRKVFSSHKRAASSSQKAHNSDEQRLSLHPPSLLVSNERIAQLADQEILEAELRCRG
ncbi:MAG: hypothetical protein K2W95_05790 [Candidatus Obscuribacterales bacterium]|nr:hypothetical protein [Candidatus Obscuribacterales bacterium]